MKILYDGFIYQIQVAGGINRYLANIVTRLPENWTPVLTVATERQLSFPAHPRLKLRRFSGRFIRPRRLATWAAKRYFLGIEAYGKFDLIHTVFHLSLTDDSRRRRVAPVVLTIHDMIPELFRREVDPNGAEAEAKRRAVATADAIICVSENTRHDLLDRHRLPAERVFVVPLASELSREMSWGPEPVPERPYFLFVGTRAIYKNFVRLLLAFGRLAEKWPDLEISVVGTPFDATERGLLNALHIRDRVKNLGHVSDRHLAKLYRCSVAFLYPSLYEGFGIPPLEAMSCGAVVITSACSSLPEVVGDAAILIDPQSIDDMTEAMLSIRDLSSARRSEMEDQGIARAKLFDWNRTVDRTIEVYHNAASG